MQELKDKIKKFSYNGKIFFVKDGQIDNFQIFKYSINQIADCIKHTVSILVNQALVNELVKKIEKDFKGLINILNQNILWFDESKLESLIQRIKSILAVTDKDVKKEELLYITLFIIFDALLFHELIADLEFSIEKLSQHNNPQKFRDFLLTEWKKILEIDYQPIFLLAYEIIQSFPTIPETDSILFSLSQIALHILYSGALRSHDLMGRIYHKLLLKTTGKYYATYYTALPSAILLSNLIFRKIEWDYHNEEFLKNLKIMDPACGSGTLLSSSYKVLKDIYSSIFSIDEIKNFYKHMVENCIYGIDVLDYATHLTLVTLMQHSPKIKITKSNIYTFPIGFVDNEIEFGSLSYLKSFISKKTTKTTKSLPQQLDMYAKAKSFVKNPSEDQPRVIELAIKPEDFDVVIMNPPFSRSAGDVNVKYGYIDETVRKQMMRKEKNLIKGLGFKGIGHAGLGALFIILADRLVKENGIVGIVIPRAILSAISWKAIRDYLMKNYEIKFIISNHDPGNENVEGWNWSENTQLGEVMIIMRKKIKSNENNNEIMTVYINLWNKPKNELEALDYSFKINPELLNDTLYNGRYELIKKDNKTVGSYYKMKQSDLIPNWLYPCLFSNPELNNLVVKLINLYNGPPIYNLVEFLHRAGKKIFLAGLDRKQIEELFKKADFPTNFKGIWGQPSWLSKICPQQFDYLFPKKTNSHKYYSDYCSDLLIVERIWTNNSRMFALLCDEKVLSTLFWEIKLKNDYEKYKKIIVLWFNSTYGIIQLLSFSINNGGVWFNLKKENLINLQIPDFIFNEKIINKSNSLFDKIKDKEFQKIPEEFKLSYLKQGIRFKIDRFFYDLNSSLPMLNPYYELFCNESILGGNRL